MILYKTGGYQKLIEEVEVTRATEKTFWTVDYRGRERKQARQSSYCQYWDTLEEAKAFLRTRLERRLDTMTKELAETKSKLIQLDEY